MDWVPVVKPHQITRNRWSNRHQIAMLEDLTSPYLVNQDSSDLLPGVLLTENNGDVIYVSSPNTVTVLLQYSGSYKRAVERTEVARGAALLPNISDVQVFETQLSVCGIVTGSDDRVLLHTMYHVISLAKRAGKYEKELLHRTKDHILSVIEGSDKCIYILTVSRLLGKSDSDEITPLLDISDLWRVTPIERAAFLQYNQWFVVLEPTAIHFVNEAEHHMACTIPTEYLQYTEKFLNFTILGDKLVAVSSNYILIHSICSDCSLELLRRLSHNVADAHFDQFYLQTFPESQAAYSSNGCSIHLRFSVFSNLKCSYFNLVDCPESNDITFIIPYKVVKLKFIQTIVLDKANYLSLTVDKRNCVTQRINSGICGAHSSSDNGGYFLLNEHKDLFYTGPELSTDARNGRTWNSWLSSMKFEQEYWVESHEVDLGYKRLLSSGLQLTRSTAPGVESASRDQHLAHVEDKYSKFLVDTWDWV